jgi:hypothetical protein
LLRRTLPKHHLNEHVKGVVRLGAGLIATIAALVLGLLIAAAKDSFDTQSTHLKHITADLILLDNILAQYGPEARPIREEMRSTVGPFVDRLWREKEGVTSGPFETDGAAERVDLEMQKLSPHDAVQRSLQARAVQISNDLAQVRFLLFAESENLIPSRFLAVLNQARAAKVSVLNKSASNCRRKHSPRLHNDSGELTTDGNKPDPAQASIKSSCALLRTTLGGPSDRGAPRGLHT